MRRGTFSRALAATGLALGINAGCGMGEPRVADAPPYEPPPFAEPPPKMKGANGESYQYGSNPDYQKAMQQMQQNMR